ncbi:glycosyltransferase [Haloarcula halophila]|uniref:glycosyltransferase n=1 Tax=Haloarcula TaxID=2237 RepID=UPI0023E3A4D3|nr:glycosyltransferase [Halomicroarcula sp. DFY41]
MNVLVVSHLFPTPTDLSSGIFVRNQVEALATAGHQVRVIAPVPYIPDSVAHLTGRTPSAKLPGEQEISGISVEHPRYVSLPRPETLPLVAFSVREAVSQYRQSFSWADVVNAHVAVPDGFACYPVAHKTNTPLVTTIHGADLQKSIHRPFVRPLVKRTVRASDRIIVNSTKIQRLLETHVGTDIQSHVVHNGVPVAAIDRAQPCLDTADGTRIVSVGSLTETKGHRYVLDALARLSPPFEFVVVGTGPQRANIERKATERDIRGQVRFMGELPQADVFSHLKSADIFVLPSYVEAFGIAYLEAMACRLPVVACRGEGPEDFVTDRKTGFLVPPREVDPLATLLQELIEAPELRDRVGARAERVAHYGFTWKRNAEVVGRIYESVCEERTGGRR